MFDELARLPNWVVCRADKIPLRVADGKKASPTFPADWASYEDAVAAVANNSDTHLGFVLTAEAGICCIDLDASDDPQVIHNQNEILNAFTTYTEISISGRGKHIWCKAKCDNRKFTSQRVEVYSHSRFILFTGNTYKDLPIVDCQSLVDELIAAYTKAVPRDTPLVESQPETRSDNEVCVAAAEASNGELFKSLYLGQWIGKFQSQSEADLALCNIIAFYTDNIEQVARIFRASALGQRDKAKRDDYLFHPAWGIVRKSFDNKAANLDFTRLQQFWMRQLPEKEKAKVTEDTPYNVDWTLPTGVLGEVISHIYNASVYPTPEIAIAAGIAFMAGICGRSWNTSTKSGLNSYTVLLANTGAGKESMARGIGQLHKAILHRMPLFITYIGPSEIASPQALLKHLPNNPCFLSHKPEVGLWLQNLTAKYAKSNEKIMKQMILDLFQKSGVDDVLQGAIYSDNQKNVPSIQSPAFSILGDSTPGQFYKALSETNIEEGLVPRFTVIQVKSYDAKYNPEAADVKVPAELLEKLLFIIQRAEEFGRMARPKVVEETEDAKQWQLYYQQLCRTKTLQNAESIIGQLWNRAHIKVLRLGSLIAVGNNPDYPVVQLNDYLWAQTLVEHGINLLSDKYQRNEIGETSLYSEQLGSLLTYFKKFAKSEWSPTFESSYRVSHEMWLARALPYQAIQKQAGRLACYTNDRYPAQALHKMLEEFVLAGWLIEATEVQKQMFGKRGKIYILTDDILKAEAK